MQAAMRPDPNNAPMLCWRRVAMLIGILLVLAGAIGGAPLAAEEIAGVLTARPHPLSHPADAPRGFRRLDHDRARGGLLYVPSGYDPKQPAPLLLLFHGAGGDPRRMVDVVKRDAERRGVIVMAPASSGATWDLVTDRRFGEDARAIDALLGAVFARYAVDPARIAVAGFSDGASYALSLGLSNGDLFRGVAAFAPGFVLPVRQQGRPDIFIAHGRADSVLPIDLTSRQMAPALRTAGYRLDYVEFDGDHAIPATLAPRAIDQALGSSAPAGSPADRPLAALPLAEPRGDDVASFEARLWPGQTRRLSRFEAPLCLRVVGAPSTLADQIATAVRSVAAAAGAAVAGRPCRPNLLLSLRRDLPTGAQAARCASAGSPATWRYQLGRAGADGPPPLLSAAVFLDKARAEALPADAVGAFTALVGLAGIDPCVSRPPELLLALFERETAPRRLTTPELDLLRRLYALPRAAPGNGARARVPQPLTAASPNAASPPIL